MRHIPDMRERKMLTFAHPGVSPKTTRISRLTTRGVRPTSRSGTATSPHCAKKSSTSFDDLSARSDIAAFSLTRRANCLTSRRLWMGAVSLTSQRPLADLYVAQLLRLGHGGPGLRRDERILGQG